MSLIDIASLFVILLALAATPSTSVALVITRTLTHGICGGLAVAAGIVLGDILFILLVALGLSVVADTMGWLFLSIKYLGAVYLIWLGYQLLISQNKTPKPPRTSQLTGSHSVDFIAGLALTLGDIKAIFFYISLLPTFIELEALTLTDIGLLMVITIVAVGGVKLFYVFAAQKIADLPLATRLQTRAKNAAGCVMLGAGSYLIAKG